jgi:hypothetical protein
MSSSLRPSERAADAEIERSQKLNKSVKTGIGIAGTALSAGVASKLTPFLSEYIPTDLAIKGISKISPKLGDFLQRGLSQGLDAKEGLGYIKDNFSKSDKKMAANQKGIIKQYSPELYQFISEQIQNGIPPIQAATSALKSGKFKKAITDMILHHKTPFSSIIESDFGTAQQPQQQGSQQPQQRPSQGQQMQQQPGQGQQALMSILQKINQTRGGG